MSQSRSSSYPLAGGSRSRRRILLHQPGDEQVALIADEETEVIEVPSQPSPSFAGQMQEPLKVVERDPREVYQKGPSPVKPTKAELLGLDALELELMQLKEQLATREHLLSLKEADLLQREQELSQEVVRLKTLQKTLEQKQPHPELILPGARLLEEVRGLLKGHKPVTWVFTGENPVSSSQSSRDRRTYIEQFSDRVRGNLARSEDVVIDTAAPAQGLRQLVTDLASRALRFTPDVVSVMVSPYDCREGKAGQREFQKLLWELVQQSRENEFRLILQTPNRLDLSIAPDCQALRSYIRLLREASSEYDLPLIDHWAYWKKKCPSEAHLRNLLESNGISPNSNGHKALARLLFATLNMHDNPAPTPEHSGVGLEYVRD